jgi:hypothetical protein
VVEREFEPRDHARVFATLAEYGSDVMEGRAPERVQLAALKLSAGNLAELREHIESAKRDFRDVLLAAEYPAAGAMSWSDFDRLSADMQQRIYDADWEQYARWLGGSVLRRRTEEE